MELFKRNKRTLIPNFKTLLVLGNSSFNRAKLLNVGFLESNRLREGGWKCFVFHDVDRLPMDERNLYTCPRQPRHMSASVDKDNYKLPYADLFGGVSAMTYEQVQKVNGFSNEYWGWGCEDDDMSYRIRKMNYHIARYKMSIARYTMLNHKRQAPNPKRHILKRKAVDRMQTDGINTVDYNLTSVEKRHLLTHIIVDIEPWERKRKAHDKIKPNIGTKREIVKQRNREDKALSGNVRQRH
ncbi:beta-1,4-N-acetylgalactosaminyltransferase bre-4 [Phthorimaea operculella]|nr:beta-1,4-N-acetylgalactosaminyltransferase bre-4 [Phthorimaea operculella]